MEQEWVLSLVVHTLKRLCRTVRLTAECGSGRRLPLAGSMFEWEGESGKESSNLPDMSASNLDGVAGLPEEAVAWSAVSRATSVSRSWILTRKLSTSCLVTGRRASLSVLHEHCRLGQISLNIYAVKGCTSRP